MKNHHVALVVLLVNLSLTPARADERRSQAQLGRTVKGLQREVQRMVPRSGGKPAFLSWHGDKLLVLTPNSVEVRAARKPTLTLARGHWRMKLVDPGGLGQEIRKHFPGLEAKTVLERFQFYRQAYPK